MKITMDNGVLVCLDGSTGKDVYRERLSGAATNSSPIASGEHIYLTDTDGATYVIKAGRDFVLLATNQLGERITASPAVSGNRLYYGTDSHLYSIEETGGRETAQGPPVRQVAETWVWMAKCTVVNS